MNLKNIKTPKKYYALPAAACVLVFFGVVYAMFFASFSKAKETAYVCIDTDDTVDSVYAKVADAAQSQSITGFKTVASLSGYGDKIRTGRYSLKTGDNVLSFFRRVKNGQQEALNLVVPSVRTLERLSSDLSKRLMLDSLQLLDSLQNVEVCRRYGYDTTTIACMFVPNTYEVFWNTSITKFLERMHTECERFWNDERKNKAKALGMTQVEVVTLASIIDEETSNNAEKPMIAGMYYNRLQQNMPLQADPTIKFARKDFAARRVYRAWLDIDSPYNTYKNAGLPPGPIRIPSVAGVDAVLNMAHHSYLYMCAKEDFSGTHNFATTYAEHQKNAARYSKALNERGVK